MSPVIVAGVEGMDVRYKTSDVHKYYTYSSRAVVLARASLNAWVLTSPPFDEILFCASKHYCEGETLIMTKVAGLIVLLIGVAGFATAVPCMVPEIDPSTAGSPLALLFGAWLIFRSSRKK